MIRHGVKNGIDYAIREGYVSGARVKELHLRRRYGTQKQYSVYLGGLRYPFCSRKKEEKFINDITKAYAEVWEIKLPKQGNKSKN